MVVRLLSWRDVGNFIQSMSEVQKDELAAAGAHPDELTPLFALVSLRQENVLEYLSEGSPVYSDVAAGTSYLSTARICRSCGCTELDCSGCMARNDGQPCHWVEADLCSACLPTTPKVQVSTPTLFGL